LLRRGIDEATLSLIKSQLEELICNCKLDPNYIALTDNDMEPPTGGGILCHVIFTNIVEDSKEIGNDIVIVRKEKIKVL